MSASPESLIHSISDLPRYVHMRWTIAETTPLDHISLSGVGLGLVFIGTASIIASMPHGIDLNLHPAHTPSPPDTGGHSADYMLSAHTIELRDGPSPSPTSNSEPPVIPWNFPNTEVTPSASTTIPEPIHTSELPSHPTVPTHAPTTLSPTPSPTETSASTPPLPILTDSPDSTPAIYGSTDKDEGLGIAGALCIPATLAAIALGSFAFIVRRSSQRAAAADDGPSLITWVDEEHKKRE